MIKSLPRLPFCGLLLAGFSSYLGASSDAPLFLMRKMAIPCAEARGSQCLGASAEGELLLLRENPLAICRWQPGSSSSEETYLQTQHIAGGKLRHAAISTDSDRHLMLLGSDLAYFRNGRQQPLPSLTWPALAATLVDGTPLVAVDSDRRFAASGPGSPTKNETPQVLRLTGRRWNPLLRADAQVGEQSEVDQRLSRILLLAPGAESHLWVADQYRYRLRKFSSSGKLLETVEAPSEASPVSSAEQAAANVALAEKLRKKGIAVEEGTVTALTRKPILFGLLEAPDGRVYLFAPRADSGRPALDRWDPYLNQLDRLLLDLDYQGLVSMAATSSRLVLAGGSVGHGPWTGKTSRPPTGLPSQKPPSTAHRSTRPS